MQFRKLTFDFHMEKNMFTSCLFWIYSYKRNFVLKKLTQSQTLANDHLRMTTTCLQRPLFWRLVRWNLWTTTTCQQRPQFYGTEGGHCTQVWLYVLNSMSACHFNLDFTIRIMSVFEVKCHLNTNLVFLGHIYFIGLLPGFFIILD